jgi:hypothetical protein
MPVRISARSLGPGPLRNAAAATLLPASATWVKVQAQFKSTTSKIHPGRSGVNFKFCQAGSKNGRHSFTLSPHVFFLTLWKTGIPETFCHGRNGKPCLYTMSFCNDCVNHDLSPSLRSTHTLQTLLPFMLLPATLLPSARLSRLRRQRMTSFLAVPLP